MITYLINILVVFLLLFMLFFLWCDCGSTCVFPSKCTKFSCVFHRCEGIHDHPCTMIAVCILCERVLWAGFFIDRWIARSRIYCYSIRSYTCRFHSFVHRNKGGVINMRRKPFKIETHTNELSAQHQSNTKRMETILRGGASFLFIQQNRYNPLSLFAARTHKHAQTHIHSVAIHTAELALTQNTERTNQVKLWDEMIAFYNIRWPFTHVVVLYKDFPVLFTTNTLIAYFFPLLLLSMLNVVFSFVSLSCALCGFCLNTNYHRLQCI